MKYQVLLCDFFTFEETFTTAFFVAGFFAVAMVFSLPSKLTKKSTY